MNSMFKLALTLAAGAAFGAAAVQGLHAQAKPKAYLVTESEVLDAGGLASYTAAISEWGSLDQVQAYLKSAERTALVKGKKVVNITHQFIVEASQ